MGSWAFVFFFLFAMAGWALANSFFLERFFHHKPFDPYPYILLNLLLSTLAGLQGAILLIASKRADRISSELAKYHLDISEGIQRGMEEHRQILGGIQEILNGKK
jgi:uncharacterized membrane protein